MSGGVTIAEAITVKTLRILALFSLVALAAPAARGDSYTIPLRFGCNLIANQLDAGNNTLDEVLLNGDARGREILRGSYLLFYPSPLAPESTREPCGVHFIFTNGCIAFATTTGLAVCDEFDVSWFAAGLIPKPWKSRVGQMLFYTSFYGATNYTFQGSARVESGTPIELPAGGCCLLSRETAGVGTYENIIGTPPSEGHQVVRLRPGAVPMGWDSPTGFGSSLPWCFASSNLEVHTFSNGVWTPSPPQLDVGEAAWFCAPPPLLALTITGTNVALSWPVKSIDFTLEGASELGAPNSWGMVNSPIVTNNLRRVMTLPIASTTSRFYRLKRGL